MNIGPAAAGPAGPVPAPVKEQACSSNIEQNIDSRAVTVSVLGEKLVLAVTQERQQPPDVSTNIICTCSAACTFTACSLYTVSNF